jgi:hypothetical protein
MPKNKLVALLFVVAARLRDVLSTTAQQYVNGKPFEKPLFEQKVLFELKNRGALQWEKKANKGSIAMICLKKKNHKIAHIEE